MTVVHVPATHRCTFVGAPVGGRWWLQRYPELRRYPEGTVRACPECGRTWVADTMPGYRPSCWRREGRLERWLRQRAARRAQAAQGGRKIPRG